MAIFKDYAKYYDYLYQDKDYEKESDYLEKIFKKYLTTKPKSILDFGCGTGNHSLILTRRGYQLTGVDFSKAMLKIGQAKAKKQKLDIDFIKGDVRKINLRKKHDAVIAMSAVMGYQTSNLDFAKALLTARKHLKRGGIFVFDLWFGPAVLADKPKDKIKEVVVGNIRVKRKTKCRLHLPKRLVAVYFTTEYFESGKLKHVSKELHKMRFFFRQELLDFLNQAGLGAIGTFPFLKLKGKPSQKDWSITLIARR